MAATDLINLKINLTATPIIVGGTNGSESALENVELADTNEFNIYIDAIINYNALAEVLNKHLPYKRFTISEGLFHKYIVIQNCKLLGDGMEKVIIEASFSGSYKGTFYFTGKPAYNSTSKRIEIHDLNYDLQTNDWLLKAAKWLFDKRITNELKKHTSFDVSPLYTTISQKLNTGLNKEWRKGIESEGKVTDLTVSEIHALKDSFLLRCLCKGNLILKIQF